MRFSVDGGFVGAAGTVALVAPEVHALMRLYNARYANVRTRV